MKKERKVIAKRVLMVLMAIMMVITYMPMSDLTVGGKAQADTLPADDIEIYFSASNAGTFLVSGGHPVAYKKITVSDRNSDGKIDIDESIYAAHEAFYEGGATGGYATADSQYGLSVTKLFGNTSGNFGYYVDGQMAMGLSDQVKAGDHIETFIYENTYPDTEGYSKFECANLTFAKGLAKKIKLTYVSGYDTNWMPVFSNLEDATITVDGVVTSYVTDDNGEVLLSLDEVGTHIISAIKKETTTKITAPVCIATVIEANTKITVPSDASVSLFYKGYKSYNYRKGETIEALGYVENDNLRTYLYSLTKETNTSTGQNGLYYFYRIGGENYITNVGTIVPGNDLTLTSETLAPEGKTKGDIDRDLTNNSGSNVGDIYLNINEKNYLRLSDVGSEYQLVSLRNWQIVENYMNTFFVEPDYKYIVINENGEEDNSVITVTTDGKIVAKKKGVAIVLVTYDAMYNHYSGSCQGFLGAIWPENTGVFVVSVGETESQIETGLVINKGLNTAATKRSVDALDSEHDVIYFTGESGEYTFKPETGCVVSVANPTITEAMTFSGFSKVSSNSDESFTVTLKEGRNILKIEKNGKFEYQVITAKKVSYTINNGEAVHAGDPVSITFDTIYHPCNKLAGIYNDSAKLVYSIAEGYSFLSSKNAQYNFASSADGQTISGYVKTVAAAPTAKTTFIIPVSYEKDTYTISGGYIYISGWGDVPGNHRGITLENGRDANLNAGKIETYLGQLPDIEIPIAVSDGTLESITANAENAKTEYYEGQSFDTSGLIVTAKYDNEKTQIATNYTITPSVLTKETEKVTVSYRGKTAEIPVTVKEDVVSNLSIATAPVKVSYSEGEAFNPTGMVVTANMASGNTKTVKDYSYEPKRTLTNSDTSIKITYAGKEADVPITVSNAQVQKTDLIKVYFTLLGDSKHSDESVHTLKSNNLTTWISSTQIEVEKGAKVIDVVSKALGINGIAYSNASGNYISEINGLGEFDNGNLSGWMYTLNGTHPNLGVAEQTVSNGDRIVFHYTDDYTKEEGSEKWTEEKKTEATVTKGAGGAVTAAAPTEVKVTGDTAKVTVDSKVASDLVKKATENKATEIKLEVTSKDTGSAKTINAELPTSTIKDIVNKTDASLVLDTPSGDLNLNKDVLKEVASKAGSSNVNIEIKSASPTEAQADIVGKSAQVIELSITAGTTKISDFNGGVATFKTDVPAALKDKDLVAVYLDAENKLEEMTTRTSVDKKTVEFDTMHFSTFALVDREEAGLTVIDPVETVKNILLNVSVKTKLTTTAKKSQKITVSRDKSSKEALNEIKALGYTVKYKFLRSTKKNSGYKLTATKKSNTYTYTKGTKGKKYYYKTKLAIYDKEGKLVTTTNLKVSNAASKKWTK